MTRPLAPRIAAALVLAARALAAAAPGPGSPAGPPAELAAATSASPISPPHPLEVVFFDVRQGDSTLIRTPDGKNILVDGGVCRMKWNRYDAAERAILPYLKEEGIRRLDLVIGTHPDFDHIGGLLTVLSDESIEVGCYLDPGKEHTTDVYRDLLAKVKERKIPYRKGRTGMRLNFGKGIDAEIMSPPKLLDGANDCSVVLRVRYGKVSFLLTGDAEGEAEVRMRSQYGRRLASTVLKAGHHGSKNSSGESFLDAVRPRMVVISCGANNKFGHPHRDALDRFEAAGAKIYRTDEMGTIVMRTDGKTLAVSKRVAGAAKTAEGGSPRVPAP